MSAYRIAALEGSNPMGFLAALGCLEVTQRTGLDTALKWEPSLVGTPVLTGVDSFDGLLDMVLSDRDRVLGATALRWPEKTNPIDDVKFASAEETRRYLQACRAADDAVLSESIAAGLVPEVSVDGSGKAKPTDLHFTAGNQKLLEMVRTLGEALDEHHLREALEGPWSYSVALPSFMWDASDDRVYALSATNPATGKKPTIPGADWLAFRALALLPVVGRLHRKGGRTLTPGAGGRWKTGHWTWPLWLEPLVAFEVRVLMGQMPTERDSAVRARRWSPPLGTFRVLRSSIVRSDQGGYGTVRPPRTLWAADPTSDQVQPA